MATSLQQVLAGTNPPASRHFSRFAKDNYLEEGLLFWLDANDFALLFQKGDFHTKAKTMYDLYMGPTAKFQVNVSDAKKDQIKAVVDTPVESVRVERVRACGTRARVRACGARPSVRPSVRDDGHSSNARVKNACLNLAPRTPPPSHPPSTTFPPLALRETAPPPQVNIDNSLFAEAQKEVENFLQLDVWDRYVEWTKGDGKIGKVLARQSTSSVRSASPRARRLSAACLCSSLSPRAT